MKVRGGNEMQRQNGENEKIVRDLKLVYVCSQFGTRSSLNCRAFFFTTLRPERQASNSNPHGLHPNGVHAGCIQIRPASVEASALLCSAQPESLSGRLGTEKSQRP